MKLPSHQEIFTVFFAIFWGLIANVQPRWKAFQWPLIFTYWVVFWRVMLAFFILNVIPVLYFGFTLWIIDKRTTNDSVINLVLQGVIPAFGMFGLYRIWLAIVETKPDWFYFRDAEKLRKEHQHIEPTYRQSPKEKKNNLPVVDLAVGAGLGNLLAALFYIGLAYVVPCHFAIMKSVGE